MKETDVVRIVLTTVSSVEEAEPLARRLVEERLAACVSLLPQARSFYWWQGRVEEAAETLLLIKTSTDRLPELERGLRELHPYQTPEFLVLPVAAGSEDYLDWLAQSLSSPR